jgi:hypothetical protein
MSILVVRLVPEGLLFAADRNITQTKSTRDGYVMRGQTQRSKLHKWPNRDAIIGYVGEARIDGTQTEEWLYSFIGRNIDFSAFDTLATALGKELEALMQSGRVGTPLIIHLGGFELEGGEWTPRIWFIHNTAGLDASGPLPGTQFQWSDEIPKDGYFPKMSGNQIRADPRVSSQEGELFSFRQGADLAAFNTIDSALRLAMAAMIKHHPLQIHKFPTDLDEWSKHLRMAVLGYSAYFAAFYASFEQLVGGGADVVSVPWPDP